MKILITSALPYANGELHLGHLKSTFLPSDIYARYCRLFGHDVLYVCATDEHGTPIMINAEKQKKSPEEFAKYYHEKDKEIFKKIGISFDKFSRTTSKENKELTLYFFKKLKENGYIYQKDVEVMYCPNCKKTLPDRYVKGKCPYCGAEDQYSDACEKCGKVLSNILNPKCIICGGSPVKKTETHFFFRLSSFEDELREYIINNPNFKEEVKKFVLEWIRSGLHDWDISRNISWGFKIPNSDLVFYVWFDAPIGYISSAKSCKDNWEEYWNSKVVHFIGKDIIYHHYLFWPAMLSGVGLKKPDAIPVRGFLNLEGKKFSKSRGWYISIEDFIRIFPVDYLRYYLTTISPNTLTDSNFTFKDFEEKINNELIANIGNFVYRTLKLIEKINNSKIPNRCEDRILDEIKDTKERVEQLVEKFMIKEALDEILKTTSKFNKLLSDKEPWKTKDLKTLYLCSRWVSALVVLLYPIIPDTCKKLAKMVNLEDIEWGEVEKEQLKPGTRIIAQPLFRKIKKEDIQKMNKYLNIR